VTSTPAVDDGVAHYDDWQGGLHAVGLADGRLRWTTHVAVQDGPLAALNSSPAVVGNLVFVSTGDGRVVAVTRRTGKVRRTTVLDTHFASTLYSSPAVAGHTLVVGCPPRRTSLPAPTTFAGASSPSIHAPGASCGARS
jgi:outer membrane protein assembly factor BamB